MKDAQSPVTCPVRTTRQTAGRGGKAVAEIVAAFCKRHNDVVAFDRDCPEDRWTSELPGGERTMVSSKPQG